MADQQRPFGWRPFTEEQRAQWREIGLDETQIAEREAGNTYRPNAVAIFTSEVVFAVLDAAARRHGPEFIRDVQHSLSRRVAQLAASSAVEDQVESLIIHQGMQNGVDWDAFTNRASDPDGKHWPKPK